METNDKYLRRHRWCVARCSIISAGDPTYGYTFGRLLHQQPLVGWGERWCQDGWQTPHFPAFFCGKRKAMPQLHRLLTHLSSQLYHKPWWPNNSSYGDISGSPSVSHFTIKVAVLHNPFPQLFDGQSATGKTGLEQKRISNRQSIMSFITSWHT